MPIHVFPAADAAVPAYRWQFFTEDELKNISYHASLGEVAMEAYIELRRRQAQEGGDDPVEFRG